jgi:hypothetical protein
MVRYVSSQSRSSSRGRSKVGNHGHGLLLAGFVAVAMASGNMAFPAGEPAYGPLVAGWLHTRG